MKFIDEGNIILVYGDPGSGKTNFVIDLLTFYPDNNIAINLKTDLPRATFIHDDIEMLNYFLKYKKKIIFIIDEALIVASAKEPSSKTTKNIDILLAMIRKLRACIIWIIQRGELSAMSIRDLASTIVYKPNQKTAIIQDGSNQYEFENIPSCTELGVSYETYSFSGFEFKLDLRKLFNELSKFEEYDESIKRLEEIASYGYDEFLIPDKNIKFEHKTVEIEFKKPKTTKKPRKGA